MRGYHTKSDLTRRRALMKAQGESKAAGGRTVSLQKESC